MVEIEAYTMGFIVGGVISLLIICITIGCCYSNYNDRLIRQMAHRADREESDARYEYSKYVATQEKSANDNKEE